MFALNLHQLQVEVGDTVLFSSFALEIYDVSVIFPLHLERVVCSAHLEDLSERLHVHAKRGWTVALEVSKCRLPQKQRHESYMRAVHGLHLDALLAAIEIYILAQILHGVNHLLQE